VNNLQLNLGIAQILPAIISLIVSTLDFYSLVILLQSLNFRFGYLEEITNFILSFQDFSRYPLDVFMSLPVYLLIIAVPFSALTTIPTIILIEKTFPFWPFLIFLSGSLAFIYFVRKVFYRAVRDYSSSG